MIDDENDLNASIPDLYEARFGVLKSQDDIQFGLPSLVRRLGKRKEDRKGRYFIEQVLVKFADEIESIKEIPIEANSINHERTYIDHANLILYVLLPTIKDHKKRASIRHEYNKEYSMGIDDLKTRAAITAYIGLPSQERKILIEQEKKANLKLKGKNKL